MNPNEDVCQVILARTPEGTLALAGLDDFLVSSDLGDAQSREARRTKRKKARFSRAKSTRKAAIAARLALKLAARAGLIKKGFLGSKVRKAGRLARRAVRKEGKGVSAAVLGALTAVGLSKAAATKYTRRSLILLGAKPKIKTKGAKKGTKSPLSPKPSPAEATLIAAATKEELEAEASGEASEEADDEDEIEEDESEFDEEYDSGPGGSELDGFGALPEKSAIDRIKPFVPWALLGLGLVAILKYAQGPAEEEKKTEQSKKKKQ